MAHPMSAETRKSSRTVTFILVAVGLAIPLACLPFLTGYNPGAGLMTNLFSIKISVIPFRFVLAFGILLIFAGIWRLDRKEKG